MAGRLPQLVSRYALPKAGSGGMADYSQVQPGDVDSLAKTGQQEFGSLRDAGLQFHTPELQPPDVPDLGKMEEAHGRGQLADLVHGIVGKRTLTPYGVKMGQKAGEVMEGPQWNAAKSAAADPWVMEQARVDNANKLHAFVNQYAQLKAGVSDKNTQQALDNARDLAIMRNTKGIVGEQTRLQQETIDATNRRSDAQMTLMNERLTQGDKRLSIMEENAARAAAREKRAQVPAPVDAERYGAASSAITAAENADKLLQDKSSTDPFQGAVFTLHPETKMLSISGGRISASPAARQLQQQLAILHHYLLMQDPRQGTRFGASLLQPALQVLGDNPAQARGVIRQLLTGPMSVKQAMESKYSDYDWGNEMVIYNNTHPLPPEADINAPGDKANIRQEMEKRGIKF